MSNHTPGGQTNAQPRSPELSSERGHGVVVNSDLFESTYQGPMVEPSLQMDKSSSSSSEGSTPPIWVIHLVIIAAQVSFGTGSVVGRLGLQGLNPILFALIREAVAGPLLCLIAYLVDKRLPKLRDLKLFLLPGIFLFLNQFAFIVGLKLSSSVTGSAWQPSQAIIAAVVAWLVGFETLNFLKVSGILVGTGGALFMILYGADFHTKDFKSEFGGNILFFINCLSTVLYLIVGKPVLEHYPSSTVTGYSYITASILMTITATITGSYKPAWKFVCETCEGAWVVPLGSLWELAYWIIFQSFVSYLCMTWANKYADASVNLAYTVLQPLTAAIVSSVIILTHLVPKCPTGGSGPVPDNCLFGPALSDLGAVGIAIGLAMVIFADRKTRIDHVKNRGSNLGIKRREPLLSIKNLRGNDP